MEDRQHKVKNAHRRSVEIIRNLPGSSMASLDGEKPEADYFLTSDPGAPADERMDLTSSNGMMVFEAAKKQVENIVSVESVPMFQFVTPKLVTSKT